MSLQLEPNLQETSQRILDLLRDDLGNAIREYRLGQYPEETKANQMPALYVVPDRESARDRIAANPNSGTTGGIRISQEYHVVVITRDPTPAAAQARLYSLKRRIQNILEGNLQLRRARRLAAPDSAGDSAEMIEPQCATLSTDWIGRISRSAGQAVDGMTVIVRTVVFK